MASTAEREGPALPAERIRVLRERMQRMQRSGLAVRTLPTLPAVAGLLPGGGLRPGASYSVDGSVGFAMALLAGPVAAGAWCGVVGVPEFGAEAAAGMGVELSRVVLVPHPGDHWLAVTAALADALGVVVVRPPGRVADSVASKLSARLRRHDAMLIALGDWPQVEARFAVAGGGWQGLGSGHGHLVGRRAAVRVYERSGRVRERGIALPVSTIDATVPATAVPDASVAVGGVASDVAVPRLTRVS